MKFLTKNTDYAVRALAALANGRIVTSGVILTMIKTDLQFSRRPESIEWNSSNGRITTRRTRGGLRCGELSRKPSQSRSPESARRKRRRAHYARC